MFLQSMRFLARLRPETSLYALLVGGLLLVGTGNAAAQAGGGAIPSSVQDQIFARIKQLQDATAKQQVNILGLQQKVAELESANSALEQANAAQAAELATLQDQVAALQSVVAGFDLAPYATSTYVDSVAMDVSAAAAAYTDSQFSALSATWAIFAAKFDELLGCLGLSNSSVSYEAGDECWGGDGQYATSGATQAQCEADCDANAACIGYSWNPIGAGNGAAFNCWLISECNAPKQADPSWSTFYQTTSTSLCGPNYQPAGECFGGNGKYASIGASQEQCQADCDASSGCVGYSWNANGAGQAGAANCWLIESCSTASFQSDNWLTYCTDLSICVN